MSREELVMFLRENLRVSVEVGRANYSTHDYVQVKLLLDGSLISRSFDYLPIAALYAAPVPAVDLAEWILVPRNPSQEWFDAVGNELHVSDSDVKGMFNAFAAHLDKLGGK